jgi:signal transduction histidine kinase
VLWAALFLGCAAAVVLAALRVVDGWVAATVAWAGIGLAACDTLHCRRAYLASAAERAGREEQAREEEAKRRVAEERLRIARELHDVVAHQIALAHVQAGVAAHVLDRRPDQARQALGHVRDASRSALDELRATVGLLRQRGEPAAMEPAPGLGVLDQLLDGFRRDGLRVTVECRCGDDDTQDAATDAAAAAPCTTPRPLPVSVDLTAYRVIQESLTNVRKHAGPGAGAVVRISRDPSALEVVVDDDGAPGPPQAASGHGLLALYERAQALGGVCHAGARPGGGFRVWLRLPLAAPPRSRMPVDGALG